MQSQVYLWISAHERTQGWRNGVHDESIPAGGLGGECESHNQNRDSRDVSKPRQAVLRRQRCLPNGIIWIRLEKKPRAYLLPVPARRMSPSCSGRPEFRSELPSKPAKQFTMYWAPGPVQLQYRARSHWGKDHECFFQHPKCHVQDNFSAANIEQVLELQQRHDPRKALEPELFTHVLQKHGPAYSQFCTLHYRCYCQEDSHCPHRHACKPSPAFS